MGFFADNVHRIGKSKHNKCVRSATALYGLSIFQSVAVSKLTWLEAL